MALALLDFVDDLSPLQRRGLDFIKAGVDRGLSVRPILAQLTNTGMGMSTAKGLAAVQYFRQARQATDDLNSTAPSFRPRVSQIPVWYGRGSNKYRYVVGTGRTIVDGEDTFSQYITVTSSRSLTDTEIIDTVDAIGAEFYGGSLFDPEDSAITERWRLRGV